MSQTEPVQPVQTQDDEIDLIDLFVVLLRYRRMIIGLSLLALVGAGLLYFWWPARQYAEALEKQRLEAELILNTTPTARQFGAGGELLQLLKKPDMLYQALAEAGYDRVAFAMPLDEDAPEDEGVSLTDPAQRPRALSIIQERIIGNRGRDGQALEAEDRIYSVSGDGNAITLRAWDRDPERAAALLLILSRRCETLLAEVLEPIALSVVDSYDRLLAIEEPSSAVDSAIKQGAAQYDAAQRILSGDRELYYSLGGVSTYERELRLESFRSDMRVKAVVIVMAAFFLAVFLAFLLNAVRQVRANEESMAKIREALGKEPRDPQDSRDSRGNRSGRAGGAAGAFGAGERK